MQVLLCLQMMSHIIENSGVTGFHMQLMQANLTTFEDILGGCERLLSTPIPISYTRHTGRFLLIWLTVLPYPMWPLLKWGTIPAIAFMGLLLLGVNFTLGPPAQWRYSVLCHLLSFFCLHDVLLLCCVTPGRRPLPGDLG